MPTDFRPDRSFLALMACIAATSLGYAVDINDGRYAVEALTWLSLAFVCAAAGISWRPPPAVERFSQRALPHAGCVAVLAQAAVLLRLKPLKSVDAVAGVQAWPYLTALVTLVTVAVIAWRGHGERWAKWLLALACGITAVWVVHVAPDARIDVRVFHHDAAAALFAGRNPYAITFPNIYPDTHTYAPGFVRGGRLLSGYVYPPVTLLVTALGEMCGDARYALGAAWAWTVWLIAGGASQSAWTKTGPAAVPDTPPPPHARAVLAAALFALTPRGPLVLEMAWTEPVVLLLAVAAVTYGGNSQESGRARQAAAVLLGLFAVSKQYTPLLAPCVFLLPSWTQASPSARVRFIATAGAAAAFATLPFVLWSPADFYRSAWRFHSEAGLRTDSLNYVAWWSRFNGLRVPDLFWGKVLGVLALAWSLQRAPTTRAGAAMAMGFVALVMVAFNNVAFCNYYWFMVGCFATAFGLSADDRSTADS